MKLIGICGLIGSGKGTVGEILVNKYKFKSDSFAAPLKDITATLFGWERKLLEGDTKESREFREKEDEFWSDRFDRSVTPRWVLQQIGTEVMRNNFHDSIWVDSLMRRIQQDPVDTVITDVRFPNEIQAIVSNGGEIWEVQRGNQPDWYLETRSYTPDNRLQYLKTLNVHPSEWSWIHNDAIGQVIDNNGTIEQLEKRIEKLVKG